MSVIPFSNEDLDLLSTRALLHYINIMAFRYYTNIIHRRLQNIHKWTNKSKDVWGGFHLFLWSALLIEHFKFLCNTCIESLQVCFLCKHIQDEISFLLILWWCPLWLLLIRLCNLCEKVDVWHCLSWLCNIVVKTLVTTDSTNWLFYVTSPRHASLQG